MLSGADSTGFLVLNNTANYTDLDYEKNKQTEF